MFWRDWSEALTGFDPDEHDGSFEWVIVIGLLLIAVFSRPTGKDRMEA